MTHPVEKDACRLGREEHDGSAYCHAHRRFVAYAAGERKCPRPGEDDQL